MASSVSVTYQRSTSIRVMTFTWVSAADGSASGVSDAMESGQIYRIVTVPSSTEAPTNDYGLTLTDQDGIDVAEGMLVNRLTATTQEVNPVIETAVGSDKYAVPVLFSGPLTLTVASAGSGKGGIVRVYYR